MTLSYALAIQDFVAFNRHVALVRSLELLPPRRLPKRLHWVFPLLLCAVLWVFVNVWAFVVGFAVWHLVCWLQSSYVPHRFDERIRRLYSTPSGQAELGPQTLTASADGLHFTSRLSAGHLEWSAVQTVAFTASHAFIYVGVSKAFILPRAAVPSEQYEAFIAIVRSCAPRAFPPTAA